MKHIPNLITSLNLASGFISIVFVINGDITAASWFILAAMGFDFLDGFASRLLKAYSDIGKELDSLADMVSFGVAPGLIIYNLLCSSLISQGSLPTDMSGLSLLCFLIVPATMPVCAGLRLAKFNIDTEQTTSFRGLPTPACALAVISLIFAKSYGDSGLIQNFLSVPLAILTYSIILSILMVTRIPLLSLKMKHMQLKGNVGRYVLIIVCALLFAFFRFGSIPWIIPSYIAISLVSNIAGLKNRKAKSPLGGIQGVKY